MYKTPSRTVAPTTGYLSGKSRVASVASGSLAGVIVRRGLPSTVPSPISIKWLPTTNNRAVLQAISISDCTTG